MGEPLKFDYYYGIEAEQFSFYRVPRLLIKDERFKGLSSDAKLLYGLMLDRMSLSMKNGWLDEENRAYIIYVATRFCGPIINPVACHGINRYNDMRTEKGKGSRTPAFSREPCSETTIKTMIIISKYEVEYKEEEDIFHQQ